MASLDDVVQVTISRQTQSVSRRAFGWALILSIHTRFAERIRWYSQSSWAADMVADGFATTDEAYLAAQNYFSPTPCPTQVAIGRRALGESTTAALTACLAADPDWYGLILTDRDSTQVMLAAAWIESNKRLFVNAFWDANVVDQTDALDTTSIGHLIKAAGYRRTGGQFTRGGSSLGSRYPEAAWIGACFPYDPGTVNWAHKTLSGITVDPLTTTQHNNAHAKYVSTYETIAGVNVTEEGWTGNGDFLDITQASDWLESSLQEAVFQALVSLPKIPFTDFGIGLIKAAMLGVFKRATDNGVLAPFDAEEGDFFELPKSADVSVSDKAARTLNAPTCFQRRLSGALNHVIISGNLSL